ncbi:CapA family protein [Devosia sp.]|uniref:CapA family protein n=1 Tax=Devosia sp. TaxID=1871048 RepID=UPI002F1B2577
MALTAMLLAGDVMTGRGIDQILPHPSDPVLYEGYLTSAADYVRIAERANGPIPRGAGFDYVWGDALDLLAGPAPVLVNLETAVTRSDLHWPKGINYRMHPDNLPVLAAAGIDCCTLANNHVLDWGERGLLETLDVLAAAGIATAGAGRDATEAAAPAVLELAGGGRLLVHAASRPSSGVPAEWAAGEERPGVAFLPDGRPAETARLAARIAAGKRPGDIVVCSLHWGPNWGYGIDPTDRRLAHQLIEAGADVVCGHSSHHPKAAEVHRGKLVVYGCGDFLNDYEGIGTERGLRSDLSLLWMPVVDSADGSLAGLEMVPFRIRNFRLAAADSTEAAALHQVMDRECRRFGRGVALTDGRLRLELA